MKWEFTLVQLTQVLGFLLAITGAGAAVHSSMVNSIVRGWKEQAEQLQARQRLMQEDLEGTKRRLEELTRDYSRLNADHEKLKERHIEVLNESRNLLLNFFEEVRRDIRGIRQNMQALRRRGAEEVVSAD